MKRKITTSLIILAVLLLHHTSYGQRKVAGKITDGSGEGLPGVSVVVKGTSNGTITNFDGMYSLMVPEEGAILTMSFIGFKPIEKQVGALSVIDVKMQQDTKQLDEVVVTAFGVEQQKKSLGYAVEQLEADELMESQQTNVINSLQGRVAGVTINGSSGQPGAGSNILIRGITSLNPSGDNQPLIVIDGIIVSNNTDVADINPSAGSNSPRASEQGSNSNRLADVNPNDIASVNILKGPSAAALYGARASNGAIVITTKSGQSGKTVVNLSMSQGWDVLGIHPEYQDEYREGRFGRLRFRDDGSPLRFQSQGPKVVEGTPVYDNIENFFETGRRAEYGVSVSGGNEKARFYTSFGRLDQSGITPGSEWERTSFRVKGDITATKNLNIRAAVAYTRSGGNRASSGDKSIMSSLSYMTPTFDMRDYINPDGSMRDYSGGIIDNPFYVAEFVTNTDDVNRITASTGFNYQITEWLTADYTAGIDYYNDTRNRFVPPGIDLSSQTDGFIVDYNANNQEINSNFLLTASKSLTSGVNLSLTLGQQITERKFNSTTRRGEGFSFKDFNDAANLTNFFGNDRKSQQRGVGYFFDAKADYKGYLFLNVTGRYDISSTLPENNNSYFYPSTSLGFVFSEFIPESNLFTYGKLRASFARVGKDAAPHSIGTSYQGATAFPFGSVNGFRQNSTAGNANLEPEFTNSVEFGTDLRFFNGRFGIDFTVYQQNSTNTILEVPVSNSTGFARYLTNSGEIENQGYELSLNATPIQVGGFQWNVDMNLSRNVGTVKSVANGIDEIEVYNDGFAEIIYKLVPGGRVGDLYGNTLARNQEGRVIVDANGFPTRARDEDGNLSVTKVGNAFPDFILGFNNRLSYKGFTLSALLEWRKGGEALDQGLRNGLRNGALEQTETRYQNVIFDGVKNTGTEDAPIYEENDIVTTLDDGGNTYRAAWFVDVAENTLQDISWVRLRTLSLSYQLPSDLLSSIGVAGANVTLTGNNLYLSTPFRGYDPESNYFGSGSNIYGFTGLTVPGTRSYLITVNLRF